MAYSINLTNGTTLIPGGLSDGTVDTTHSSLTLIGRDFAGYGQFLNENLVYMLENFANGTGPANPLKGQLWWDTNNNILRVWSGSSWKISTGATSSPFSNPPSDLSSLGGDLWFDTTNSQLKVYTGTAWIVVGPVATPATGNTGAVPAIMTDTSSGSHIVIQFIINGTVWAIFSKDTFSSLLTGFSTVVAGLNFSSVASPTMGLNTQSVSALPNTLVVRDALSGISAATVSGTTGSFSASVTAPTFNGTLSGNVTAPQVSATTISATTISTQGISASSGITGSILTAAQPNITALGNVNNLTASGTINFTGYARYNGSELATIGGSASFTSINSTPIGNVTPASGAFTSLSSSGLTVSGAIIPAANTVINIGSTSNWFNVIYGKSTQAQYADLAERYAADAEYEPGTVVELGGTAEVTKVVKELSENVFGVISTNAAYLMNGTAGSNLTHPPVALTGRVPVKVVGLIKKGDRLVSAGNGYARAGASNEITPWNAFGRALVDKTTDGEGIIEAFVSAK